MSEQEVGPESEMRPGHEDIAVKHVFTKKQKDFWNKLFDKILESDGMSDEWGFYKVDVWGKIYHFVSKLQQEARFATVWLKELQKKSKIFLKNSGDDFQNNSEGGAVCVSGSCKKHMIMVMSCKEVFCGREVCEHGAGHIRSGALVGG